MSFASEEEAEAKHLQATFTAIAKKALDYALDEAGKNWGSWGEILGAAKDVAEAWVAETERAAAAAGEVKVVRRERSHRRHFQTKGRHADGG
jgi:hypothetical protein